jgi:hypothetical protein
LTEHITRIESGGALLALVVRAAYEPTKTTFVTSDELLLQLGFIVYPAGSSIPRHRHLPIERHLKTTSEVLQVRRGRCTAEIYDLGSNLVATVELNAGDVIVLAAGGHGFRVHEDTVLCEVKQGPYVTGVEKERF